MWRNKLCVPSKTKTHSLYLLTACFAYCAVMVSFVFLSVYLITLPTLDSNDNGFSMEGILVIIKKNTRDIMLTKASHLLDSYLNPITALCIILLLLLILCIVFLILLIIPS
jgi:hypothetical protein